MAGFRTFNFVADNTVEKETTPLAVATGELVVVRFETRTDPASVFLKITSNGVTTLEPIIGIDAYPTSGFLSGTNVSVVVRFNAPTNSGAKGIIEVGP